MATKNKSHGGKRAGAGRKPPDPNTVTGRVHIGRIHKINLAIINNWLSPAERKGALLDAARAKRPESLKKHDRES